MKKDVLIKWSFNNHFNKNQIRQKFQIKILKKQFMSNLEKNQEKEVKVKVKIEENQNQKV